MQQSFAAKGADSVTALTQSFGALKQIVRREANIMAFNDAFLTVTIGLVLAAILVWFCKRPEPGKTANAEG
jgi:hypothetical protein